MTTNKILITNGVLALAAGLIAAALPLPWNAIACAGWLIGVLVLSRRHELRGRRKLGLVLAALHVAIFVAVVAGAAAAPVKTVDVFKSRSVSLPKSELTLAEIGESVRDRNRFPIFVEFAAAEADAAAIVRFPQRSLTLGEFIATIERDSGRRHHFRHCGNGWTVLWGGDCSFGLQFEAPK